MPDSTLQQIELPTGETIWARVTLDPDDEYQDRKFGQRAAETLHSFGETIQGVVRSVAHAVGQDRPTTTAVEIGVEFTVKSGKVLAVLAELGGKTSVKVTLTWEHGELPIPGGVGAGSE
ncbi:MAG: hypothetical protein HOV87_22335 [Catenulispora sp.]|nr:hypothetical protein [Catenulispora sp.]